MKEGIFSHLQGGWNCSEIVTSGQIFVLTLNRASALTVKGNEQNFLLPQIIVAITKRIGLESKHHHHRRIGLESKHHHLIFLLISISPLLYLVSTYLGHCSLVTYLTLP